MDATHDTTNHGVGHPMARDASAAESPVDWEANAALFGGHVEMGQRYLRRFVELTAPMISALRGAAASRDQEELGRLAHKIRGGSAAVAAVGLQSRSAALEGAAARESWDVVEVEIAQVLQAWEELESYVSSG